MADGVANVAAEVGSCVVDWPYGYDELEPYYDQVERMFGVAGEAGANPFEAPRSRPPPGVGRWGAGYKRWLAEGLRSMTSVAVATEELPHEHASIDLDPTHVDADGFPVARVTRDWIDNDRRLAAFLRARAEQWLTAAGAARVWHTPDVVQNVVAHAYGGTQMGLDPSSSVVDPWGSCHDVANLGILGPSTFSSSTGLAPVLTIEATALRTAGVWTFGRRRDRATA